MIHLACRVRSRALNGRTRTATLTDVIFQKMMANDLKQKNNNTHRLNRKKKMQECMIEYYCLFLLRISEQIDRRTEKKEEKRKAKPRDRECIH